LSRSVSVGLAICRLQGTAQAQSNEQLEQVLDQALKAIDDINWRVQQVKNDRDKPKAAPAVASTAGQ
jgi:hypothetical protein